MQPAPLRSRPRRPILNAMKNPCGCKSNPVPVSARAPMPVLHAQAVQPMNLNFPAQPAGQQAAQQGARQMQPQFQTPQAQQQQYSAVARNSGWLPASTGPQPQGAMTWVQWSGGTTGTVKHAGSAQSESVTILQSMAGGPTGVMVLTSPVFALTNPVYPYMRATGVGPTRSACPESAPYACTGFPGECSAYPSDHPLHGIDCKSYATPQPYAPGVRGGMLRNPADCSNANTPASQCKWICLPMPSPTDPHDLHCTRVPIEAQLGGAYFTSTPSGSQFQHAFRATPPRQGIFQRLARRVMGR